MTMINVGKYERLYCIGQQKKKFTHQEVSTDSQRSGSWDGLDSDALCEVKVEQKNRR